MGWFRLKKGSHSEGAHVFKAKDQENNVVESDDDLTVLAPGKFERLAGPPDGYLPAPLPPLVPAPEPKPQAKAGIPEGVFGTPKESEPKKVASGKATT